MNLISLCSFLFRGRLLGTLLSDLVMVQRFQRLSKSMSSERSFLHCLVACFKSYNYFTTTNVSLQCSVIWTKSMWRLFFLVKRCYELKEPVLLVGETGGGKTTVCQLLSSDLGLKLHILNCHQYTETSDFLGVGYHHLWCLLSICVLECHLKIFWKCLIFMN